MFSFKGELDVSKSWMNRALILQSFALDLVKIEGESSSDDVHYLKKALNQFAKGEKQFHAGLGGTTLRFLALRVSRQIGEFLITAEPALWQRPQTELLNIFKQLQVEAWLDDKGLHIHSKGWQKPDHFLSISTSESSQFLSAMILNSIDLPFDLEIQTRGDFKSEGYFKYSVDLLNKCGINLFQNLNHMVIPADQKLKKCILQGELDVSSAFSLAGAAVLNGDVEINNWKAESKQPDKKFLNFFQSMGIPFIETKSNLKIKSCLSYQPIEADLKDCPDLFPILAVLSAFAEGKSRLYGATQLALKESNRIERTSQLLTRCGFQVETLVDGLVIFGESRKNDLLEMQILFDPQEDHRMAMAATLLILKGFPIRIKNPYCVTKSYPQFYQHIGLKQ